MPVRSRVSWGAVFAGAAVALAVYFLLSVLGVALGLSVSHQVSDQTWGVGAAIWAVLAMLLSFFLGGYVTTQLAVGENRGEACIHGVILWAVLFASLLWLATAGVRMGFNAMMVASANPSASATMESQLRLQGLTPEQVQRRMQEMANDPQTLRNATATAWWTFGGILVSMLAAIGGALSGSGPTLAFHNFMRRTTYVSRTMPHAG